VIKMDEEQEIQQVLEDNKAQGITYTQARDLVRERKRDKIKVSVDTSGFDKIIKERNKLKEDLLIASKALFENKREKLENKYGKIPDSIKDSPKAVMDWAEKQKIYVQNKEARRNADPIGKGSAGQVPLSLQSGSGGHEFNSNEEMIDFLRRAENSRDSDEAKNAKLILDELFKHSMKSMDEMGTVRTKYEDKGDKSPLRKIRKDFSEKRSKEIKERKDARESD